MPQAFTEDLKGTLGQPQPLRCHPHGCLWGLADTPSAGLGCDLKSGHWLRQNWPCTLGLLPLPLPSALNCPMPILEPWPLGTCWLGFVEAWGVATSSHLVFNSTTENYESFFIFLTGWMVSLMNFFSYSLYWRLWLRGWFLFSFVTGNFAKVCRLYLSRAWELNT